MLVENFEDIDCFLAKNGQYIGGNAAGNEGF